MRLRLTVGILIFLSLAMIDLARHGGRATRWREYLFLLFCVAVAMLYGIINDQLTSRISWEYFYYGKELAGILGPNTPPDPAALHRQAIRIGVAATWAVGLIFGVVILLANNPSRRHPQLPYVRLLARLPGVILITAVTAAILGLAGRYFLLNWISPDFRELAETNLWRPRQFLAVYGIHLGGYVGGAVATVYSVIRIRRERMGIQAGR